MKIARSQKNAESYDHIAHYCKDNESDSEQQESMGIEILRGERSSDPKLYIFRDQDKENRRNG